MFIAAIKCDFCQKAHEIPCRKVGDKPDIPDGWAAVTVMVHIKGTPKGSDIDGWNSITKKFEDDKIDPKRQKKRKLFDERRKKLREKFDKYHVCEDCIEEILTGKKSVKIEYGGDNAKGSQEK